MLSCSGSGNGPIFLKLKNVSIETSVVALFKAIITYIAKIFAKAWLSIEMRAESPFFGQSGRDVIEWPLPFS